MAMRRKIELQMSDNSEMWEVDSDTLGLLLGGMLMCFFCDLYHL